LVDGADEDFEVFCGFDFFDLAEFGGVDLWVLDLHPDFIAVLVVAGACQELLKWLAVWAFNKIKNGRAIDETKIVFDLGDRFVIWRLRDGGVVPPNGIIEICGYDLDVVDGF